MRRGDALRRKGATLFSRVAFRGALLGLLAGPFFRSLPVCFSDHNHLVLSSREAHVQSQFATQLEKGIDAIGGRQDTPRQKWQRKMLL